MAVMDVWSVKYDPYPTSGDKIIVVESMQVQHSMPISFEEKPKPNQTYSHSDV